MAETQKEETRILQRAYIAVEPQGIQIMSDGLRVIGHVGVKNSGNLPAKSLAWFVTSKISSDGQESSFPIGDLEGSIVLTPGTTATLASNKPIDVSLLNVMADVPQADRAKERPAFLYVWGSVRYDDGFIAGRITRFCHRYNWTSHGRGKITHTYEISEQFARYHEHGNDAT